MPAVLVTGANRGLGLEHTRQYLESGWQVFACARDPLASAELTSLKSGYSERLELCPLDVTDQPAVEALAADIAPRPIDILLNNAGSFGPQGNPEGMAYQSLEFMDYGIWRQILEVNLLAPFHMAVCFREHLARSERKLLVMMSSGLASIERNQAGHSYAYRTSKVGLNMLAKGMSREWQDIIVIAMSPGWCRTDLGGPMAEVDPAVSVRDQQATFERLGPGDSGRYLDRTGATVPW